VEFGEASVGEAEGIVGIDAVPASPVDEVEEFLAEFLLGHLAGLLRVLGAARHGLVDTIISDADTRKYVIGAFEMLYTKRENRPNKKHGTI
jgi:acetyl-CoA carboxylase carboxyltransferase component